jgi:hypothetical protein
MERYICPMNLEENILVLGKESDVSGMEREIYI